MPTSPLAKKIQAQFYKHYRPDITDAELFEDYRFRAPELLKAANMDPAGFNLEQFKISAKNNGYELDDSHDTKLGGLWTGTKSAVNSFGMGLPSLAYKHVLPTISGGYLNAKGEDLISEAEMQDNGNYALAGNVLGSLAGLGKFSAAGKLGRYAGGALAGKLAKNAVRGEQIGDVVAKMLGGGVLGVDQEDERQRLEAATNFSGQMNGNPMLAKAIAGVGGMAMGVPLRSLHGAGMLPKKMMANPVSSFMENAENFVTGVGSNVLNAASAQEASGEKQRADKELGDERRWLLTAAMMGGLSPQMQNWVGRKWNGRMPGRMAVDMDPEAAANPQANAVHNATQSTSSAAPPSAQQSAALQNAVQAGLPPGMLPDYDFVGQHATRPTELLKHSEMLDSAKEMAQLREVGDIAKKSKLASDYKMSHGLVSVQDPKTGTTRIMRLMQTDPYAQDGSFLVSPREGDGNHNKLYKAHPSMITGMEVSVHPKGIDTYFNAPWDKNELPGSGFMAIEPQILYADNKPVGAVFGTHKDSAGNLTLAVAREGHPHRFYATASDLDDPRLNQQFGDILGEIQGKQKGDPSSTADLSVLRGLDDHPKDTPSYTKADDLRADALQSISNFAVEDRKVRARAKRDAGLGNQAPPPPQRQAQGQTESVGGGSHLDQEGDNAYVLKRPQAKAAAPVVDKAALIRKRAQELVTEYKTIEANLNPDDAVQVGRLADLGARLKKAEAAGFLDAGWDAKAPAPDVPNATPQPPPAPEGADAIQESLRFDDDLAEGPDQDWLEKIESIQALLDKGQAHLNKTGTFTSQDKAALMALRAEMDQAAAAGLIPKNWMNVLKTGPKAPQGPE